MPIPLCNQLAAQRPIIYTLLITLEHTRRCTGALKRQDLERMFYLAVPLATYKTFFELDFPKAMVVENQVKMIIYDAGREVIVESRN